MGELSNKWIEQTWPPLVWDVAGVNASAVLRRCAVLNVGHAAHLLRSKAPPVSVRRISIERLNRKYRESSCLWQFCSSIQLHRTYVIPTGTSISAQIGRGYQGFRGYVEGN